MARKVYEGAKGTAKRIRKILKEKFKGTKFSVRSSVYSGGSSVRVSWTDGPREDKVKSEISWLRGANFDGMTDLKEYRKVIIEEYGEELEIVGADFIFCSRELSAELKSELEAKLHRMYGHEFATRILNDDFQRWHWLNKIETEPEKASTEQ